MSSSTSVTGCDQTLDCLCSCGAHSVSPSNPAHGLFSISDMSLGLLSFDSTSERQFSPTCFPALLFSTCGIFTSRLGRMRIPVRFTGGTPTLGTPSSVPALR